MSHDNVIKGKRGEALAEKYLSKQRFKVLTRRFRTRWGEIDLIAKNDQEFHFIEVKYRTQNFFGEPFEAVTAQKIKRLKQCGLAFLSRYPYYEKEHMIVYSILSITEIEQTLSIEWIRLDPFSD
ncbi:MAG: YraN family protein [Deltaproteobacteria bacterium]|nr:YraN family protein [Deltaproteobacteria bacterium]